MQSIAQTLTNAQLQLAGSDSAKLDSEILLARAMNCDRTFLYTWPEKKLSENQCAEFHGLLQRRVVGEPIAYILGKKQFWSLDLAVNSSTLIPRPETELLVEIALQKLPETSCKIIDLGTGTGAIALSLAKERPQWQVIASDKTELIVQLARVNAQLSNLKNVACQVSDWFATISEREFDLVISNPPYIDASDVHLSQGDVRFEPRSALVADKHGLADIEKISQQALSYLKSGGWLILEHGYMQGALVRDRLNSLGYARVETFADLAGNERVTIGKCMNGEK